MYLFIESNLAFSRNPLGLALFMSKEILPGEVMVVELFANKIGT